jgi:glutamine amidotransferase
VCRFAAYLGDPLPLSTLLYDGTHPLEAQAHSPREQLHGEVNVDGTGLAWWQDAGDAPLRYVTERTPWSDVNLPALAPRLEAGVQLAAVRSATVGMPFSAANVAPFTRDGMAFAHNGFLETYRGPLGRALVAELSDEGFAALDAVSDSLALFLWLCERRARNGSEDLADAVAATVLRAAELAEEHDRGAVLNLVVSDGERLVATRAGRRFEANTLYYTGGAGRFPAGTAVASEPLDDGPGWTAVPEDGLLEVTASGARLRALAP